MIHATVGGVLLADGEYFARGSAPATPHGAQAHFTISTRKYLENEEFVQLVSCTIRGSAATALRRYLVLGKRVIVSGELVLLTGARLHINARVVEFLGGGVHELPEHEASDDGN